MPEIKERPILFSGPMVRAILEGRKTVTRRAISDKLTNRFDEPRGPVEVATGYPFVECDEGYSPALDLCSYGRSGDRLWVRETWVADAQVNAVAPRDLSQGEPILYPADGAARQTGCAMITPGKSRPSIHMPRWASRILLEITDVRVERLQDISEEQALAEGIVGVPFRPDDGFPICTGYMVGPDDGKSVLETTAAKAFAKLWQSTGGDWDANPWVWVVEFRRVQP
ncbi:hypothetical protein DNK59_10465 [Pseudomonas sp. TKO26]|uniref:hypothetical protein n=1 Tax=unclassified Pseudomonas TaxID=196821 RepID=UPI000D9A24EF|nr:MULTISPECIES: hypothetical protein [unclassified Pseudomonas]PYY88071.1 hypothetical protein DNK62_10465 [Pseudomonas sp. TKO30]PYY91055.1 hypothetical protein DNK61_10465 [Pseudomonas sp. TKO29]PYY93928.1 hypothetical protein DNK59_10465 [Pseudomonas sp. TKO26]PYZ00658.1 hypothetical protein DNK60_10465 [Pseudomonas sp. TKO14]